jgi:hypothetical protein
MTRSYSFLIVAVLGVSACIGHGAQTLQERKEKIESMSASASPEAMARKARSDKIMQAEGVPINKLLPAIESEQEAKRRTKEEIAYRALALLVVAVRGEGLEQPRVEELVKEYSLGPHLTPKEQAFLKSAAPSEHDRIQFTWRYESAWTLLWALGYVDSLGKPTGTCDVQKAVTFMKDRTATQFLADAKLRPLPEILDQADLIYRYHWAVDEARVTKRETPAGLDPGVTVERHYALNWLIGYEEQEWDDISTDT